MKRKVIVLIGYLIGALSIAVPWWLSWIIYSDLVKAWLLSFITVIMLVMYVMSVTIITWDQDNKIKKMQKELEKIR